MARARTVSATGPSGGFDKTDPKSMQGAPAGPGMVTSDDIAAGDDWSEGAVHRGRLRVRTLVTLRWLVVGGETALLLVVMSLGFIAPFPLCFAVVGAGAWINLLTRVASP